MDPDPHQNVFTCAKTKVVWFVFSRLQVKHFGIGEFSAYFCIVNTKLGGGYIVFIEKNIPLNADKAEELERLELQLEASQRENRKLVDKNSRLARKKASLREKLRAKEDDHSIGNINYE